MKAIQQQKGSDMTTIMESIRLAPDDIKTRQVYFAAMQCDGYNLHYVPDELKTPEMCLAAWQQDVQALEFFPDELKTPEMCLASVQRWGPMLRCVPDELKTPEMCLTACRSGPLCCNSFTFVPIGMRTIAQYAECLKQHHAQYVKSAIQRETEKHTMPMMGTTFLGGREMCARLEANIKKVAEERYNRGDYDLDAVITNSQNVMPATLNAFGLPWYMPYLATCNVFARMCTWKRTEENMIQSFRIVLSHMAPSSAHSVANGILHWL